MAASPWESFWNGDEDVATPLRVWGGSGMHAGSAVGTKPLTLSGVRD
jgi:hypothetical protein